MACFIAPGCFLLKKRKKTEPLSLFPPLTSRQVSFRLWPYVEVIYFGFDFGILHRVFDLHGRGVDRGVSALYAAGQRHQPASAADLLLCGGVKERTIQGTSQFLIGNMGLFFIPAIVGTLEYLDVLKLQAIPFLVVTLASTPVVYAVTAWSIRLFMKMLGGKEADHD